MANATYRDRALRQLRSPASDTQTLAAVLADPAIGGFSVDRVVDGDERTVRRRVAEFFANGERDDLLLLHFSCHGVKDPRGRLHLAVADTELTQLAATAVPASFVADRMAETRSQQVVLMLDCCYSGAFASDAGVRADRSVHLADQFPGIGHIVLTASSAIEYAFEDSQLALSDTQPSIFTGAVVTGLRTGEADLDGDGEISVDELYDYASRHVRASNSEQTPMKWAFGMSGSVVIANSVRPAVLPKSILDDLASDRLSLRRVAVVDLCKLLIDPRPAMQAAARGALVSLRDSDDSTQVREDAATALGEALATPRTPVAVNAASNNPNSEPAATDFRKPGDEHADAAAFIDPRGGGPEVGKRVTSEQTGAVDAGDDAAPRKRRPRKVLISAAAVAILVAVAMTMYIAISWSDRGSVTYTPIGLPPGPSEQSPIKLPPGTKAIDGISFDTTRTAKTRCEESEQSRPLSIVIGDLAMYPFRPVVDHWCRVRGGRSRFCVSVGVSM